MSTAAVFLDRDNTIIHNDGDLGDPEQVFLIQGAASAIASLRGLNFKIVVVTNQGGVARGKYTEADVEKTNQRVADLVKAASGANIDRFYYCPYHPLGTVEQYKQEHDWRKPAPGMILQAAKDMQIDLSRSWMIGDQMRDVQAGAAAGVRCILLRADAQELQPLRKDQLKSGTIEVTGDIQHFTARNLVEAVRIIAKQRKPEAELASGAGSGGEPSRPRWDAAAVKASRQQQEKQTPTASPAPTTSPAASSSSSSSTQAAGDASAEAVSSADRDGGEAAPSASSAAGGASTGGATSTGGAAGGGASAAQRPFRPWNVSSQHEPRPAPKHALTTDQPQAKPAAPSSEKGKTEDAPAQIATQSQSSGQSSAASSATTGDEDDTAASPATGSRPLPSADQSLRQILQELRSQRQHTSDFSYMRMCSVVLLIVAVFLLLAGLLLGSQSLESFMRWSTTAIVLMLAAICLLLMER